MTSGLIASIVARYRNALILAVLLMIAETAATLTVPWLGGTFAESLLHQREVALGTLPLLLAGALAAQAALRLASSYLITANAERMRRDLRIRLFDHLLSLPLGYYQERQLGNVLSLFTREVPQIANYLAGTLARAVPMILVLTGSAIQMIRIDWRLAAIALAVMPPFIALFRIAGRRLRAASHRLQHEEAAAFAIEEESLSLLPVIKEFTREDIESRRYRSKAEDVAGLSRKVQSIYLAIAPCTQFAASLGAISLLWLASGYLADGSLTPGALVSFLLYALLFAAPLSSLASLYGQSQLTRTAFERLETAFAEMPEGDATSSGTTSAPLPRLNGDIAFLRVSFAYPGRPALFEDFSLDIRAGEVIAFTGANGAGKSTLLHLLLRLYVPASGTITIGGADIAAMDLQGLRRQIAIVPQHVLLMNASVRDNIAYGRPDASLDDVIAAARIAQAHDFISALPAGYDAISATTASGFRAASASALRSPGRCSRTHPSSCSNEATAMFDPSAKSSFVANCVTALAGRTVI